jgi:putative transposase
MTKREYVRHRQYFFSVFTSNQRPYFESAEAVSVLNAAFAQAMRKYPFEMDAIVILPDHLHCIWTLPDGDDNFSRRWRLVKLWFTRHCYSRFHESGKKVWQPRFWEHMIRDEQDYQNHVDYIHYNPVNHGYTAYPCECPYSSFNHYVQRGWLEKDWGE